MLNSRLTVKHFLTGPMSEKKCSSWYLLVSPGMLPTCSVLHWESPGADTVMVTASDAQYLEEKISSKFPISHTVFILGFSSRELDSRQHMFSLSVRIYY